MSATHFWSGRAAPKSRSSRSGAGAAAFSGRVVRTRRRRETPWMPARRMRRATRFWEQETP